MVQLVDLDNVPSEALTQGRDKPVSLQHSEDVRLSTVECFALARDDGTALCVGGLRHLNFLDERPLMWCCWFEEAKITLSELRMGRELLTQWFEGRGSQFFAEVKKSDTVAQKFAEWLGFQHIGDWEDFNIYVRIV
jgi:hypothetical protein